LFDRVWLAEGEKELGIDISDEAIKQMKDNIVFTDKECVISVMTCFLLL
jgi:adenylosuccinate lyase